MSKRLTRMQKAKILLDLFKDSLDAGERITVEHAAKGRRMNMYGVFQFNAIWYRINRG